MYKIPEAAWVVVTDGVHARVMHNVGKGIHLKLQQVRVIEPADLLDDGPSGRMPPEASQAYVDEATFAKQLAHWINSAALAHEFEHMLLVADPQTLGQIRPQLHAEASKRIIGELAKTLTKSPLEDIEHVITATLD
jgi:protein required for attachment to host cells